MILVDELQKLWPYIKLGTKQIVSPDFSVKHLLTIDEKPTKVLIISDDILLDMKNMHNIDATSELVWAIENNILSTSKWNEYLFLKKLKYKLDKENRSYDQF